MPIKLLHHKSWHVWKKDNIAKVRRDEQKHEEEQKQKRKKDRENDGERRLKKLRHNIGESSDAQSHVNLFQPEEYEKQRAENEEYVEEEKKRKGRELRRAGIAPLQLGGEASKNKRHLWYNLAPNDEKPVRGAFGHILDHNEALSRKERDSERKQIGDPMLEMNKYIEQTRLLEREQESQPSTNSSHRSQRSKDKYRHKDSKRKRKGKQKKKRRKDKGK